MFVANCQSLEKNQCGWLCEIYTAPTQRKKLFLFFGNIPNTFAKGKTTDSHRRVFTTNLIPQINTKPPSHQLRGGKRRLPKNKARPEILEKSHKYKAPQKID